MVKWHQRILLSIAGSAGVPRHIAFIMDGNRRWAVRQGKAKLEGHSFGLDKLIDVLDWCLLLGIEEVSVFALSVDNLQRPDEEVQELMRLIRKASERLNRESEFLNQRGVRVRMAGNLSLLGAVERQALEHLAQSTSHNSSLTLNLCVVYSSAEELTHAISTVQRQVQSGLNPE